ncbi:hypothetical protein [Rhizobium sullae]|nr:hypothetical protein [Rhizobium sullae]
MRCLRLRTRSGSHSVKLGGKIVEVCCEECGAALKEADAAATTAATGKN